MAKSAKRATKTGGRSAKAAKKTRATRSTKAAKSTRSTRSTGGAKTARSSKTSRSSASTGTRKNARATKSAKSAKSTRKTTGARSGGAAARGGATKRGGAAARGGAAQRGGRAAKRSTGRKPNAAFMAPVTPSPALAEIVGDRPIPRTEVTKRLWAYIKKNDLQDAKNRRTIKADAALKPIFGGKSSVNMFEMTRLVGQHLE